MIIRLKKNDHGDEQKPPRPLDIVLEDKIYRNKILQNCDKLGEAENLFKISISPDYNKDEQEKFRAPATEAKKKLQPSLQKTQEKTHQKITKKWRKPNWKENVTNTKQFFPCGIQTPTLTLQATWTTEQNQAC